MWSSVVIGFFALTTMHGCGGGDAESSKLNSGADPADPASSTPLPIPAETEQDQPTAGPTDGPAATEAPAEEPAEASPTAAPSQPDVQTTQAPTTAAPAPLNVVEFTAADFHGSYYAIFQTGNRNAASHKWFQFLKSKKEDPGLQFDFEHLSKYYCPISGSPTYGNRLAKITLPRVGSGDPQEGAFSYCCTPCYCDLMDFAQVDNVTVAGETYDAPVIGLFFDASEGDEQNLDESCAVRAQNGYNSGM